MARLALVLLASLLLAWPASARAVPPDWRRPVAGPVLRSFALSADPFARGQHRGVDLAAPRGSPVLAVCGGRVTFAGRVPGAGSAGARGARVLTVSVRCGGLVATVQQLGSIAVRRGAVVLPATRLGTVGRPQDRRTRRPHVHLGARIAATGAYVDPLALMSGGAPAVPVLPPTAGGPRERAPLGPAPGTRPAHPARVPHRHAPVPGRHGAPLAAPRSPPLPWTVWAGLGCVGLGLPFGGLLVRRERRRRRLEAAPIARTA